nr:hypothetical protein [Candidatus Sigynarchaeum springense]
MDGRSNLRYILLPFPAAIVALDLVFFFLDDFLDEGRSLFYLNTYGQGFFTWWLDFERFWGNIELWGLGIGVWMGFFTAFAFCAAPRTLGTGKVSLVKWPLILLIGLIALATFSGLARWFSPIPYSIGSILAAGWYPEYFPANVLFLLVVFSGIWLLFPAVSKLRRGRVVMPLSLKMAVALIVPALVVLHLAIASAWEVALVNNLYKPLTSIIGLSFVTKESMYNTQYAVYTLAYTYDVLNGTSRDGLIRSNVYETPAPDIVDEAIWGARFLQKLIVEDLSGNPRVLCGIFGRDRGQWNRFGYWGDPSSETNNIANDSDDRMSGSLEVVSGDPWYTHEYGTSYVNALESLMVAAALARVAWVEQDFPYWDAKPYNATNLLTNATALHDAHMPMIVNGTMIVNASKSWTELWPALACTVELARWANATGNATAWNKYVKEGGALRTKIMDKMNPWDGRDWVNIFDTLITLRHHDIVVNGSIGADLVSFLDDYGNQSVLAAMGNNAFNHNVAHWIMGRKPLDICQIESLGTHNLPLYHHRYASIPGNRRGAVPGCVPNGIARAPPIDEAGWWKGPDLPWFDMRKANPDTIELGDFRSNEAYITDNAGFLTGFATLASLW